MNDREDFDEHIREQFNNYEPAVPAHIWDNIREEKDRRKPVGFFSWLVKNRLGLLLLAIAFIAGTTFILTRKVLPTKTGTAITEEQKTGRTNQENKNTSATDLVNAVPANDRQNMMEPSAAGQQISSGTAVAVQPGEKSQEMTTLSTSPKDGSEISRNNLPVDEPADRANKTAASAPKEKQSIAANGSTQNNEENNLIAVERKSKRHGSKGKASLSVINADAVEGNEGVITKDPVAKTGEAVYALSSQWNEWSLLHPAFELHSKVISPALHPLDIPCPGSSRNNVGNKRYLEFYGGPDYAYSNYSDTAHSAYLQKRKESTRFSSAFSLGIRYAKVFNSGLSIRTGINYSQVNEKFKYVQGHILQYAYIIEANGDTAGVYATSVTRYKTTSNRYRTIDVPLLVGYEFGNGKFSGNINAGLMVNIYSWQKGDILDSASVPVSITTGKSNSPYQYKTNAGLGALASAALIYKPGGKWQFFTEPWFRYNFSAANKSSISLKQKFNTMGIRLGVRLSF